MGFGKSFRYNKSGLIDKTFDYDQGYSFSLENLIKLFKEKYDLDIENNKVLKGLSRDDDPITKLPIYTVIVLSKEYYPMSYVINGQTGETISIKPYSTGTIE